MKPIIIIIFSFFLTKSSFTQTITTNPQLDKFVGVWRWTSGADTVEITLQKQVYILQFTNKHSEVLVGWHRYVKNGVLQQSSYQYLGRDVNLDFNDAALDAKTTLLGTVYSTSSNKAYFYAFWDLVLHKGFELFLTLLPNSNTQATWVLKQPRGLYTGPEGLNGVFSMPRNLVLTKL
ncbi:MAG: hypothetical protein IPO46_05715 [Chitinophagaceae bacterium]|jgi:hypothetical protein|nr:hypothetical protein [Chitinophagaceae bacterium]MBP6988512.1 hypothetical protein [Ferruginibacter sp.]MBP8034668.1 hypothetical protein [Bacteroidia bacterium]NMD29760.1 hypothetical protein [Bacteroidota bacterium]MBK7089180.1 hypothetical protein [Chitinophagaceae bacterium]